MAKTYKWDKTNKVYKYKGKEIIPLSHNEQIKMPIHLQNEYYWGEINRIDRIEQMKQIEDSRKSNSNVITVDEALEELFLFWDR